MFWDPSSIEKDCWGALTDLGLFRVADRGFGSVLLGLHVSLLLVSSGQYQDTLTCPSESKH